MPRWQKFIFATYMGSISSIAQADASVFQIMPSIGQDERLKVVILRPMHDTFPEAPESKAILQRAYGELIQIYKTQGTIGENDQEMEKAILHQAENLNAFSILLFTSTGEFRGMVRAFFPDHEGLLPAERVTLGLQRSGQVQMKTDSLYFVPDKNEWKFEIGSYAANRPWVGPDLVQLLVDELEANAGASGHLFLQTAEGRHERTYRSFYGFNTLLGFADSRITGRRSVMMETQFDSFRDKVRRNMGPRAACRSALMAAE